MTNYKQAGVDVQAGDDLVEWLQKTSEKKQIYSDRVLSGIGGFASVFNMQFPEINRPCLVTCTDGVGTKVKLAAKYNRLEGIGQDLVAMCVNDLICTGGRPLMFLDYYAVGKLDLHQAQSFLQSVRQACAESETALVGGETAEMPGVYHSPDFDCAGFAVGIVDQDEVLGPHRVQVGDQLLGFSSSGFHSNGYSLLRKVFEKDENEYLNTLLTPTRLYVKLMKGLQEAQIKLKAAAHITGGGIENLPRILPENTKAFVKKWPWPPEFLEVQKRTQLSDNEMLKTLNCGLGFVLVVSSEQQEAVLSKSKELGYSAWHLGSVVTGQGEASWEIQS